MENNNSPTEQRNNQQDHQSRSYGVQAMDYGQWTMDFLLCNVNVKIIEMLITMSLSVNTYFVFS